MNGKILGLLGPAAAGSSTGDLIGIEDTKDLSESGKSYTRQWVFKFYTGSYDALGGETPKSRRPGELRRFRPGVGRKAGPRVFGPKRTP